MSERIPLSLIVPGDNDRTEFDALHVDNMAQDILKGFELPAIMTRPHPTMAGHYQICYGGTRFEAAKIAFEQSEANPDFSTFECIVRDMTDDQYYYAMGAENGKRKDLNPMDEAHAFLKRIEKLGWTKTKVADCFGVSVDVVNDRLALLNVVPDAHNLIKGGSIPLTYAVLLAKLDNNRQRIALRYFAQSGKALNYEEFKKLVNELLSQQSQGDMFGGWFDDFQATTTQLDVVFRDTLDTVTQDTFGNRLDTLETQRREILDNQVYLLGQQERMERELLEARATIETLKRELAKQAVLKKKLEDAHNQLAKTKINNMGLLLVGGVS